MANKTVVVEQPDSSCISHIMMVVEGGVVTSLQVSVDVEEELGQVDYQPLPENTVYPAASFSDTVRDGVDLIPNEIITKFNLAEEFIDP